MTRTAQDAYSLACSQMDTWAQDCTCCGKRLNLKTARWLERNHSTGTYHLGGTIPADDSQGAFAFGSACAKRVLAQGGRA